MGPETHRIAQLLADHGLQSVCTTSRWHRLLKKHPWEDGEMGLLKLVGNPRILEAPEPRPRKTHVVEFADGRTIPLFEVEWMEVRCVAQLEERLAADPDAVWKRNGSRIRIYGCVPYEHVGWLAGGGS